MAEVRDDERDKDRDEEELNPALWAPDGDPPRTPLAERETPPADAP
jgi:hypothetical protein